MSAFSGGGRKKAVAGVLGPRSQHQQQQSGSSFFSAVAPPQQAAAKRPRTLGASVGATQRGSGGGGGARQLPLGAPTRASGNVFLADDASSTSISSSIEAGSSSNMQMRLDEPGAVAGTTQPPAGVAVSGSGSTAAALLFGSDCRPSTANNKQNSLASSLLSSTSTSSSKRSFASMTMGSHNNDNAQPQASADPPQHQATARLAGKRPQSQQCGKPQVPLHLASSSARSSQSAGDDVDAPFALEAYNPDGFVSGLLNV